MHRFATLENRVVDARIAQNKGFDRRDGSTEQNVTTINSIEVVLSRYPRQNDKMVGETSIAAITLVLSSTPAGIVPRPASDKRHSDPPFEK